MTDPRPLTPAEARQIAESTGWRTWMGAERDTADRLRWLRADGVRCANDAKVTR